jgi:hypothetical protein
MKKLICLIIFAVFFNDITAQLPQRKALMGATWVTINDLDHFMMRSKDWTEAAKNFKEQQYLKGNFHPQIAEETLKWLRATL